MCNSTAPAKERTWTRKITPAVLDLARLLAASGFTAPPGPGPAPSRVRPFRVREAAAQLGVHPGTVYREIQRGNLRAYRIGEGRGAMRVPVDALADYKLRVTRAALEPVAVPA